jgi:glycosyltransferase involved in cell wall biosynthesis
VKIHWASNFDQIGNALGYTTHQKKLREALEKNNVIMSEDSEVAVSIVTPDRYTPVPNKYNILYTMYECTTIPPAWEEPLQQADLIIVPCVHNKKLFRNYTKLPIEVCWEGVDLVTYTYNNRANSPRDPFVFLWVGASNPRKGYEHVVISWRQFTEKHPDWNCVLYMKTTQLSRDERLVNIGGNAYVSYGSCFFIAEYGRRFRLNIGGGNVNGLALYLYSLEWSS